MIVAGLGFYQSGGGNFDVTVISGEGLQATASEDLVVATIVDSPVVAVAGPGVITVTIPEE